MIENISTSITEPVGLMAIKEHLRIEHNDDDGYLTAIIRAAREQAEAYISGPLPVQTYRLTLDCFPVFIEIEKTPLISVTSISYVDGDGDTQALADFDVKKNDFKALILPIYGESFPTTEDGRNKVTIEFTAGYAVVPQSAVHAIKLICGSLYEQREDHVTGVTASDIPWSSKALLNALKKVVI